MNKLSRLFLVLLCIFSPWVGAYAAVTPLNNPVVSSPQTLNDLRAIVPTQTMNGWFVDVANGSTPGDGGGGSFWYSFTATGTDNGVTIITPTSGTGRWLRLVNANGSVTVATIAALKAITVSSSLNGGFVSVAGYYAANDGGGGTFVYNSSSSAADNGGTIIAPTAGSGRWLRQFTGPLFARWFGAKEDGTDVTTNLQAAINATAAGGTLDIDTSTNANGFTFSSLVISAPINLVGVGYTNDENGEGYGRSQWNTNVKGSILRSTATTGLAIKIDIAGSITQATKLYAPGDHWPGELRDIGWRGIRGRHRRLGRNAVRLAGCPDWQLLDRPDAALDREQQFHGDSHLWHQRLCVECPR